MNYSINAPAASIRGNITLEGSKSISNRMLILRALSEQSFVLKNLSPGDDTDAMLRILNSAEELQDVGAAGTTMRFLTAYFAIQKGRHLLTGSERMQNRPIGILVEALQQLGADIRYYNKAGFPPLLIDGKKLSGGKIQIRSDVSSQFISALMMIAPKLENGLELTLKGKIASFPYLNMTLRLMESLGAEYTRRENVFSIYPGNYIGKDMTIESDWSAGSYYFSVCALSKFSEIKINGLFADSLQGDSVLPEIYRHLGVQVTFQQETMIIKQVHDAADFFSYDFSDCPDLAQTVVVTCAALGIPGKFSGLESLRIKETDRTHALATELQKFGVAFYPEADSDANTWILKGKTVSNANITIQTYEDHRMAMAFAPLALLHQGISIEDAAVVKKSYPSFWSDFSSLGFSFSTAG